MESSTFDVHPTTPHRMGWLNVLSKEALKAGSSSGTSTTQRLANYLLRYRSSPHATTGCTPSSLFLKCELRTRLDLLKPCCSDQVIQKQSNQSYHHNLHA